MRLFQVLFQVPGAKTPLFFSTGIHVHFEISHEFDIALDALELAIISPRLVDRLAPRLPAGQVLKQKSHTLRGGTVERVWHYQANVTPPAFARGYLTREMCAWDELTTYDLKKHASAWKIEPSIRVDWRKYFFASGSYEIVALNEERTRRTVRGELALRVPLVGPIGERLILTEVKKTFDAEAATLREMATLT